MDIRNLSDIQLHDKVILDLKDALNQVDYDIYTNPGSEKNAGISGNYPDIIMTKKGETKAEFILEVETKESVNISECQIQWRKYSSEILATFYLVVPDVSLKSAQEFCKSQRINARFITYSIKLNQEIVFDFK